MKNPHGEKATHKSTAASWQANTEVALARADWNRFLAEYGFEPTEVDAAIANMQDHVEMPEEWSGFDVRESSIQGVGCFASGPLAKGQVIGPGRLHGGRTHLGRRTNHSPLPNAKFERAGASDLYLIAQRRIGEGEELTIDYRQSAAVNGWDIRPVASECAKTLLERAAHLRSWGVPWSNWANSSAAELAPVVAQMLRIYGHLPPATIVFEAMHAVGAAAMTLQAH